MHRRSIDSDHFDPMHRTTSPILFSKQPSQASKAADISRLLDPSYSSSSSSSSSSSQHHVHAYVDRFGELHDPDYRYFPIATAPSKRTTSPHRGAAYNMAARPRWELDEHALDLEEEDEQHQHDYDFSARLHHHHQKRHPRDSFSSLQRTYTPTPAPAAPPHSFESEDTPLDGDDAEDAAFVAHDRDTRPLALLRTTFSRDRKRRASSLLSDAPTPALTDASGSPVSATTAPSPSAQHHSLPASPLSPHTSLFAHYPVRSASRQHQHQLQEQPDWDKEAAEQEERDRRERERELEEEMERRAEWTPTCGQALRREWQAVTLRIRFSVFRTQRRIKNRFL